MELRYFDWDGLPAVVSPVAAAKLVPGWGWMLGKPDPILRAEEREAPELSREELATRFRKADLTAARGHADSLVVPPNTTNT